MLSGPADFTSIRRLETAPLEGSRPHASALRLAVSVSSIEPTESDRYAPLTNQLLTFRPIVRRPDEVVKPWIWVVLSGHVYKHLPRYEQAEHQFSMVFSPVMVSTAGDSTPGVGLSGDF